MSCIMRVVAACVFTGAVAQGKHKCSSGGGEPSDRPQHVVSLLQSNLQMNALEVGGASMLQPACAERKLVINSHVNYGKALDRLLASLKEFKFPLKDCVVFQGGASEQPGPRIGQDGMTFVNLTLNSFDLNSFAGLSRYKDHPLVCADMYFFIHDSTQIGPCFPQVFAEIKVAPEEVITPGTAYYSNQCVFGRSVVDKIGDGFEVPVSKGDGMIIEGGGCVGKACSIDHYATKRTVIGGRVSLGKFDVYNTRIHTRSVVWHKAWDLYKFISHSKVVGGKRIFNHDLGMVQQGHDYVAPSCPRIAASEFQSASEFQDD